MTQDPTLRAIIKQIRELDIQAKRLHTKRVELVHSLETAIDVYDVVDRGESTDRILFRHGERVEINNRVTSKSGSLFDRRATVLIQKKTDNGQVEVFFRTDSGLFTHCLAKNILRVNKNCDYEVKRRKQQKELRTKLGNPSQVVLDEATTKLNIDLQNDQQDQQG